MTNELLDKLREFRKKLETMTSEDIVKILITYRCKDSSEYAELERWLLNTENKTENKDGN